MVLFEKVTISGLFGREEPEVIEYSSNDSYKVIYGLNGSGKSTILRLIAAALNWKPLILWQTDFDYIEFEITQDDYRDGIFLSGPPDELYMDESGSFVFSKERSIALDSIPDDGFKKLQEFGILERAVDDRWPDANVIGCEPELIAIVKKTFRITRHKNSSEEEISADSYANKTFPFWLETSCRIQSSFGSTRNSEKINEEYDLLVNETLPLYGDVLGMDYRPEISKISDADFTIKLEHFPLSDNDFSAKTMHEVASKMDDFFKFEIFTNRSMTEDEWKPGIRVRVHRHGNAGEVPFPYFATKFIPEEMWPDGDWKYRPHTLSRFLDLCFVDSEGVLWPKSEMDNRREMLERRYIDFEIDPVYERPWNYLQYQSSESLISLRPDRLTSLLRDEYDANLDVLPSLEDSAGLLRLLSQISNDFSELKQLMIRLAPFYQHHFFEAAAKSGAMGATNRQPLPVNIYEWEIRDDGPLNEDFSDVLHHLNSLDDEWRISDFDVDASMAMDFYRSFLSLAKEDWDEKIPYHEVMLYDSLDEISLPEGNPFAEDPECLLYGLHNSLVDKVTKLGQLANLSQIIRERMGGLRFFIGEDGRVKLVKEEHVEGSDFITRDFDSNDIIEPQFLSSGQRQLLTMFLYLIRNIRNSGSLILIDEPEISLHISWQRRFIDDLLETLVSRYSEIQGNPNWKAPHRFLIATHSPSIIANHLEHSIELGIGDLTEEEW